MSKENLIHNSKMYGRSVTGDVVRPLVLWAWQWHISPPVYGWGEINIDINENTLVWDREARPHHLNRF